MPVAPHSTTTASHPHCCSRLRALTIVIATLLLFTTLPPASAHAQDDRALAPAAAWRALLQMLTQEGEQALRDRALPRSFPNIAAEFTHEVPIDLISQRIVERLHREPFIDMYIRWQLTSYSPPLPELDDRRFERMVEQLSPYALHPRADERLINLLNRAVQRGVLSESDQQRINEQLNQLAEDTARARAFNQPAEQFRRWLSTQSGESGLRALQLQLEHCLALVRAGWPIGQEKRRMEELLEKTSRDRTFEDRQRARIAAQIRRIGEVTRSYITTARTVENRVEVDYAITGIYEFDLTRWLRILEPR